MMAQIGTFNRGEDGVYGEIRILALPLKTTIQAIEREHDKALSVSGVEAGGFSARRTRDRQEYPSVKLDVLSSQCRFRWP
jgi:uncharacterized protein (DUF736 family)